MHNAETLQRADNRFIHPWDHIVKRGQMACVECELNAGARAGRRRETP